MPTAPLGRSLMAAAVLAGGLTAQAVVDLREIPTGRGSVLLGEPAVTGTPRSAVAGELGASCTFVDLNGDGFDEYVVGAPTLSGVPVGGVANNTGHVYIRFGDAEAGAPGSEPDEDLAALTPGQGLNIRGRVGDMAGASLAAAGDVDGDGFQDLIIGAPGHNAPGRTDSGAFYVLFGAADLATLGPLLSLVDLGAAGRARLFFGPRAFGEVGTSVAGDVDVDNDGFDDLVAGAPLDSTGGLSQNGAAYVVYGDATLKAVGDVDMATLGAGSLTEVRGTEDFQLLGSSVAGLGNYDPVLPGLGGLEDLAAGDDVALGAPGTLENGNLFTGAVFVLRGQTSGALPVLLDVDAFVGGDSPGLEIVGDQPGDQAGSFVANGGDLFGNDGFNELVIGAPLSDGPGKLDCGAFYLVPGRFGGVNPEPFDLSDIGPFDPRPAIQIWGAVTLDGRDGLSASQVGDFDTDGFLDLAVAFPGATVPDGVNFMPEAGIVIVIGSLVLDPTQVHTIDLGTQLPFAQIFRLEGDVTGARGGTSLAVGDLNGDGKPEIITANSHELNLVYPNRL